MNPDMVNMNLRKEGAGVQIPDLIIPEEIYAVEGFVPVIINVAPIMNPQMIFGESESSDTERLSSLR